VGTGGDPRAGAPLACGGSGASRGGTRGRPSVGGGASATPEDYYDLRAASTRDYARAGTHKAMKETMSPRMESSRSGPSSERDQVGDSREGMDDAVAHETPQASLGEMLGAKPAFRHQRHGRFLHNRMS